MNWGTLFERADAYEVTVAEIRERRGADRREGVQNERAGGHGETSERSNGERNDRTDDR